MKVREEVIGWFNKVSGEDPKTGGMGLTSVPVSPDMIDTTREISTKAEERLKNK
ncbi:hypothetical protein ACFLVB_00950 [Chloroflexota bacterium]